LYKVYKNYARSISAPMIKHMYPYVSYMFVVVYILSLIAMPTKCDLILIIGEWSIIHPPFSKCILALNKTLSTI